MTNIINGVKFLKHGLKKDGKYYPAHYSFGHLIDGREVVTIYAKRYSTGLPKSLNPEDNTDLSTDYFEKERVRFDKGSNEYNLLLTYK